MGRPDKLLSVKKPRSSRHNKQTLRLKLCHKALQQGQRKLAKQQCNKLRELPQHKPVNNLRLARRKLHKFQRMTRHSKPQVRRLFRQHQLQQLVQPNKLQLVRHKLRKPQRLKPHSKPQVRLLLRRVQLQQLMQLPRLQTNRLQLLRHRKQVNNLRL